MATLVPFAHNVVFEPEATAVMGTAFDKACQSLRDRGQPALVREIIAKRIVEAASDGERNPERLCERALAALGIRLASA